jgi:hypothetical protein
MFYFKKIISITCNEAQVEDLVCTRIKKITKTYLVEKIKIKI